MLGGWSRVEIDGKTADVLDTPGNDRPRFGVLFLHPVGRESPADSPVYTAELTRHRLACCAPQGGRCWWTDRVCPDFDTNRTPERHLLDNVVPWMRHRWGLSTKAIAVVGISMGGQGAVRLGLKYPDQFPVVASVAGAFDYHEWYGRGTPIDAMYSSRERCRLDTATLHLNPARFPPHVWLACDPDDEWHRGNDRLHEKLSAYGVPHVADLDTQVGGHSWEYFDAMAGPMLQFVADALEKESRRLM